MICKVSRCSSRPKALLGNCISICRTKRSLHHLLTRLDNHLLCFTRSRKLVCADISIFVKIFLKIFYLHVVFKRNWFCSLHKFCNCPRDFFLQPNSCHTFSYWNWRPPHDTTSKVTPFHRLKFLSTSHVSFLCPAVTVWYLISLRLLPVLNLWQVMCRTR